MTRSSRADVASQIAAAARPSPSTAASRLRARHDGRARRQVEQAGRVVERGVRGSVPIAERLVDPRQPSLGLVGTARGEGGAHARHDERHEERTLARDDNAIPSASSHAAIAASGSPAISAVSASPHIARQHELDLLGPPADRQRLLQERAGALDVAAPERDVAERVA